MTKLLDRRAILRGSATVAVAASLPSIANASVDPVLPLVERWRALNAEMIPLRDEDAIADLNDRMIAVEGEIAATAATSFAGLHAKLSVAACEPGARGPTIAQAYAGDRLSDAGHMTASAWADAERLALKGGAI